VISAIADFSGSGIAGFALAYQCVAALMLLALAVTLALRNDRALPGHSLD